MQRVTVSEMIQYLQSMLDRFKKIEANSDPDDPRLIEELDKMIACKEMVEALIFYPVNLRKDGKVTIGFDEIEVTENK